MLKKTDFERIVEIVKTLRSPYGCPWDRKQTPSTIVKCLKNEVIELEEAITNNDDIGHICEELGDVLFMAAFLIELYQESEAFDARNVIADLCDKIKRRHPYVFTEPRTVSYEESTEIYQEIKGKENVKRIERI